MYGLFSQRKNPAMKTRQYGTSLIKSALADTILDGKSDNKVIKPNQFDENLTLRRRRFNFSRRHGNGSTPNMRSCINSDRVYFVISSGENFSVSG